MNGLKDLKNAFEMIKYCYTALRRYENVYNISQNKVVLWVFSLFSCK